MGAGACSQEGAPALFSPMKTCFALGLKRLRIATSMDNDQQALEEARRAGIDLALLDSNLALTCEQRVLRHESALELVRALRANGVVYEEPARAPAKIR